MKRVTVTGRPPTHRRPERSAWALLLPVCVLSLVSSVAAATRLRTSPQRNYVAVYFWSPDSGWVADHEELVLTRDGGRTWTPILSVYDPGRAFEILGQVHALNPQVWWFDESSRFWVTTDGGQTWTQRSRVFSDPRGFDNTVGSVILVSPTEGWGIEGGGNEALLHTRDAGLTWQRVSLLAGGDPFISRLFFLSPTVGWVSRADQRIFRTTDGGQTWELRGQAPGLFSQLFFVDLLNGWALDHREPRIYRTLDGGATWHTIAIPDMPRLSLRALFFLDPTTGWAVGLSGTILTTTDGGATWVRQPSGTQQYLLAIHFLDRQNGWAVGEMNTILKTTDGGATWQKVDDDLKNWRIPLPLGK